MLAPHERQRQRRAEPQRPHGRRHFAERSIRSFSGCWRSRLAGNCSQRGSRLRYAVARKLEPHEIAIDVPQGVDPGHRFLPQIAALVEADCPLVAPDFPIVIEGLQGQEFPYANAFATSIELLEEGKKADVKVKLDGLPADLNGSFGGVFKLKVGHPHLDEVVLRFSGVCRPGVPVTNPTNPTNPTNGGGN